MADELTIINLADDDQQDNRIPGRNGGTLTPFKQGESGNKKGKPKGALNLNTIMRRLLEGEMNISINGTPFRVTRAEALMLEKIRLATTSPFDHVRLAAIKDIEDRTEGRPVSALPPAPDNTDGAVVFYIPNANSRKKSQ